MSRAFLASIALAFGAFTSARTVMAEGPAAEMRTGEIEIPAFPVARLDGKEIVLAPGVRIRDAQNRIVLPMQLQGTRKVGYKLDFLGQVNEIRLLDEQASRTPSDGATPK